MFYYIILYSQLKLMTLKLFLLVGEIEANIHLMNFMNEYVLQWVLR